jgi:hypothetical protein
MDLPGLKARLSLSRTRIALSTLVAGESRDRMNAFLPGSPPDDTGRTGVRVAVIKAEKGASIADDPTKRGRCEPDRIHVDEDYELQNWAKTFGVSPEEIKRAVEQVGDRADAVRQHLRK